MNKILLINGSIRMKMEFELFQCGSRTLASGYDADVVLYLVVVVVLYSVV